MDLDQIQVKVCSVKLVSSLLLTTMSSIFVWEVLQGVPGAEDRCGIPHQQFISLMSSEKYQG